MTTAKHSSLDQVRDVHEGRMPLRTYLQSTETRQNPYLLDLCFDILRTAKRSQQAIAVLQSDAVPQSDAMDELLLELLDSDWSRVRWQALRHMRERLDDLAGGVLRSAGAQARLSWVATTDPSWMNRQEATLALSEMGGEFPDGIACAATDPHWRVRDAVTEILERNTDWQTDFLTAPIVNVDSRHAAKSIANPQRIPAVSSSIAQWRADGVRQFLVASGMSTNVVGHSRQGTKASHIAAIPMPDTPDKIAASKGMLWDWDPSVLAREIASRSEEAVKDWPAFIACYVGHHDERVQRAAVQRLDEPTVSQLREVLNLLNDVRHPASPVISQWAQQRDSHIRSETARSILQSVCERSGAIEPILDAVTTSIGQVTWALSNLETGSLGDLIAEVQSLLAVGSSLPTRAQLSLARLLATLAADEVLMLNTWSWLGDAESPETSTAGWRMLATWAAEWGLAELDNVLAAAEMSLEHWIVRAGTCLAPQCKHPRQRAAAARFAVAVLSTHDPVGAKLPTCLSHWANDPSWLVRSTLAEGIAACATCHGGWSNIQELLQHDVCSAVRAAAMNAKYASKLLEHPERETSWCVLQAAALQAKRPLWSLLRTEASVPSVGKVAAKVAATNSATLSGTSGSLADTPPQHQPDARHHPAWGSLGRFGDAGEPIQVSRIAISGHYGLPPRGFSQAIQAGVNLFFWEPGYTTMSQFCCEQTASAKAQLHFMAGTFKATGKGIREDAHRALRLMKLERLTLFFLFWTRGWSRITDEATAALEQLVSDGDLLGYSLSTHDRDLACEAIAGHRPHGDAKAWDPIMVRYSAAHRGAEANVLPAALAAGVSIITFNNTCYGRLLRPQKGHAPMTAADCYRFALAHPAVIVSLSAPASLQQLEENLEALRHPSISDTQLAWMRSRGDHVYEQDQRFDKYIRRR